MQWWRVFVFYHHRVKDEFCKEVLQDFLAADGELWKLMSSEKSAAFDPKQTHPEISWFINNPSFRCVKVLLTSIDLTGSTPVSYWLKIKWLCWVLSPRIGKTSVGLQLKIKQWWKMMMITFSPSDILKCLVLPTAQRLCLSQRTKEGRK